MTTSKKAKNNPCAWCGDAKGQEVSHGICDDHKDDQLVRHHVRRFEKVPSYFERFKPVSVEKKN